MQNLKMMRYKPHKEYLNVNIVLRSGLTNDDDEGKQLEEDGWIYKALEKEVGFDLEHVKETFMEAKKKFIEESISGSQNKVSETNAPVEVDPSVLTTFLETCMKVKRDKKAVKCLQELINKCSSNENALDGYCTVRKIGKHKVRIGHEMRLTMQIRDYEMD